MLDINQVVGRGSEVLRAFADVLRKVEPLERHVRGLAEAIVNDATGEQQPVVPKPTKRRRKAVTPQPTVDFSDVDAAKADRALRNLGIHR